MAFDPSDVRYWLGEEVHLFVFRRQGVTLRYASSTRDVVIGEHTYVAAQIERDAIRQTPERAKDALKIRMAYLLEPAADEYPPTQELGDWWRPYIPSDEISVICLSYDPSGLEPPSVEWMGTVVGPTYTDSRMELSCDPYGGHGDAANQGPKAQRACFKVVYSTGPRGCNLPPDGYVVPATLTAVAGEDLTAPEFADPKRTFVGGHVEWPDAADPEIVHRRTIVAHAGTTITVADDAGDLAASSAVTAHTAGFWVRGAVAVDGIDGLTLTVPEFAGTEFSLLGGTLYWDRADGIREERPIMGHNAATGAVTILWGGAELEDGVPVSALPNCPGTWAACAARRPDPELHYGGSVYKPVRDPILEGVSMSWG